MKTQVNRSEIPNDGLTDTEYELLKIRLTLYIANRLGLSLPLFNDVKAWVGIAIQDPYLPSNEQQIKKLLLEKYKNKGEEKCI